MERVDRDQWRTTDVARILALVETDRRYYQEVLAHSPLGIVAVGADLSVLATNRSFRERFQLRREDTCRARLDQILPTEQLIPRIRDVLKTGIPQRDIVLESLGAGPKQVLQVGIQAVRNWNAGGEREAVLTVQEAITLPKAVSPAPSVAERPASLDELDAIVWELDPQSFRYVFVSRQTEEILGYTAERWLSGPQFWINRVHAPDRERVENSVRSLLAEGDYANIEYRSPNASGEILWLRDRIRLVRDAAGKPLGLTGITLDVTEERRWVEQSLSSKKVEALARLAGKLTHDVNNLLMIVGGYSEELLRSVPEDDPRYVGLKEIATAVSRITVLSSQLTKFAHIPAARPKPLAVNVLLSEMLAHMKGELDERIHVVTRFSPDMRTVQADPQQLEQVMASLIVNAVSAMPEGGTVTLETSETKFTVDDARLCGSLHPGQYAVIAVSDTGTGMDPETVSRLFEPALAKNGESQLSGLAPEYRMIRNNGGDIHVTSEPGRGTTYRVYLPIAGEEQMKESPAPRERAKCILVVEDEAGIRALVRKVFQKHGHNVLEAGSAEEALAVAEHRTEPIDLLVTDIVLPRMNGRELSGLLKAARPDLRVLYLSGYTEEAAVHSSPLPKGTAFLQKPFSLTALLDKARELMSNA